MELHSYIVVHAQEKHARIFHSPFCVRNGEGSGGRPGIRLDGHLDGDGDFVFGAVDGKHAMDLQSRIAGARENAIGAIGMKGDFREARTFDHILVHLFVARAVAGFAAGGVEDDLSAGLAARGIVMEGAAFQLKRSLNGVHVADKSDLGRALCGVELEKNIVRGLGREPLRQQNDDREANESFVHWLSSEETQMGTHQAYSSCQPREIPLVM